MEFIILPARIVFLDSNRIVLLKRAINMAVLVMNVHYDLRFFVFFIVVNLVLHLIKILWGALSYTSEHSGINEVGRVTEVANLLSYSLNSIIFTAISTIKLNQWTPVLSIETRMSSRAERIEFINNVMQIIAKGSESNLEVFLLFFKEDHCSKKWRYQVPLSFTVHGH